MRNVLLEDAVDKGVPPVARLESLELPPNGGIWGIIEEEEAKAGVDGCCAIMEARDESGDQLDLRGV